MLNWNGLGMGVMEVGRWAKKATAAHFTLIDGSIWKISMSLTGNFAFF